MMSLLQFQKLCNKRLPFKGSLLVFFCFFPQLLFSQTYLDVAPKKPITNLKLISEKPDGKGNLIRVVQYSQGSIRVTETIVAPAEVFYRPKPKLHHVDPTAMLKDSLYIVVDKS